MSDVSLYVGSLATIPIRDHDLLAGLTDDDHTQYALLAGRATPQQLAFGTASGASTGYLTSTVHATKGKYFLNAAGTMTVDEVNLLFGLGIASPGIGGPYTLGAGITIDGGASAPSTLDAVPGVIELGRTASADEAYVGIISFFNQGNLGSGATTRKQVAMIKGSIDTTNANVNGDSGGHIEFITKGDGGTLTTRLSVFSTGIIGIGNYIDLSSISAGTPNLKITATSDTPTVAFTGGGNAPTTAPAGYVEILVGASARYIPFWA